MMDSVRLQGIKDEYDVVVIGSGLAGLTGANYLSKSGYKVLILEQHYQVGGLATWFKRKGGHIFDVSLHGFPIGMIKSCRRYWSQEIADSIVQLKDIRFDNPQFSLQTAYDRDGFTALLKDEFGIEEKQIQAFFEYVGNQEFFMNSDKTTSELIDTFFPGRSDIKRLLLEPIAYANGSSEDDPALTYSIVFSNFMKKGIFTFKGGTDVLIKKMVKILTDHGVTIKRRAAVEKILTERIDGKSRVTGVVTEGRIIRCKAVFSNSNLKKTILQMIDRNAFADPSYLKQVEDVRLNNSSCQVYMGLRKGESIPHVGDLLFVSENEEFSSEELKSKDSKSRTFSFYYPETRPQSKVPRYVIVASSNAKWEDWAELDDAAYAKRKEALIQETLDVLERYIPGVRDKIDHLEAATPRTIHHFTQHLGGASFGTKPEGLPASQALPEHIAGAYHAGSVGIIMSGWLGTINYGIMTANKTDQYLRSFK